MKGGRSRVGIFNRREIGQSREPAQVVGRDGSPKGMHEMQFGFGRRRCEIRRRLEHLLAAFREIDANQDQEFAANVAVHESAHTSLLTTVPSSPIRTAQTSPAVYPSPYLPN